jgi:hypothetical protein
MHTMISLSSLRLVMNVCLDLWRSVVVIVSAMRMTDREFESR